MFSGADLGYERTNIPGRIPPSKSAPVCFLWFFSLCLLWLTNNCESLWFEDGEVDFWLTGFDIVRSAQLMYSTIDNGVCQVDDARLHRAFDEQKTILFCWFFDHCEGDGPQEQVKSHNEEGAEENDSCSSVPIAGWNVIVSHFFCQNLTCLTSVDYIVQLILCSVWLKMLHRNKSIKFDATEPCLYKTVPYKTVQYKTVRKSMKMNEKKNSPIQNSPKNSPN